MSDDKLHPDDLDALCVAHGCMSWSLKQLDAEAARIGWTPNALATAERIRMSMARVFALLNANYRAPLPSALDGEHRPRAITLDD